VPPPKTTTFNKIVAGGATSDTWLADALDVLGNPEMVRADTLRIAITLT
jgi:hypothetical protein